MGYVLDHEVVLLSEAQSLPMWHEDDAQGLCFAPDRMMKASLVTPEPTTQ